MMKVSLFKIICVQSCIEFAKSCEKSDGQCCVNYYKDESGLCKECPLGTFGTNCTTSCISGYFGKLCLNPCICPASECDAKYGCQLQRHVTSRRSSELPVTNSFSLSFPSTSLKPQSTDSVWKSTTIFLIGVLAAGLFLIARKNCSSLVLKRRSRNAEIPSVSIRVHSTRNNQNEGLVNQPDESNITSLNANVTYHHERCSSTNLYHKPNEEYEYSDEKNVICKKDVAEQHHEDVWSENGFLPAKPFGNSLPKKQDDQGPNLNVGFRLSSEDKYRPYSSIKYNRYSQKNTSRRGQAFQRESSAEPNNEHDDVAHCFKGSSIPNTMTNETSYSEIEVGSGNSQHAKELHKLTEAEESQYSLYQDIVCGPQESGMPYDTNHVDVSEYETKRFSSDHTVLKGDSVHVNSLYTFLVVDNSSKNDLSSSDNESNPSEGVCNETSMD